MPPKRKQADATATKGGNKKPRIKIRLGGAGGGAAAAAAAAAATGRSSSRSKNNADGLPFEQWRVVLTGDFIGISAFKETLKSRGVAITGAVSNKTTHLLLGRTGRNDFGHVSGAGSTKHKEAQARNLPMLTQNQVLRLLAGQSMEQVTAQPKKPAKSVKMYDKVLYCVKVSNDEQKISLVKLKESLKSEYGIDCNKGASKSALKKALEKGIEEGTLGKDGGSYKIPLQPVEMVEPPPETVESKIRRMAPERGHWRGLRVVSSKKSKSGRATCRGCDAVIAKGVVQVEVVDDSLLKMLTRRGALFDGEENGEIECGYPGFETAASKKFFVHEACQDAANGFFRSKFVEDWQRIRPSVERDVRSTHESL